jgi:hypothetical protein
MSYRSSPVRRRSYASRVRRSRTATARMHGGFTGIASGGQTFVDVLAAWRTLMGITANLPGTSVVGVKVMVSLCYTAASAVGALDKIVSYGLIVAPTNAAAADYQPGVLPHLPWLDWGVLGVNSPAGSAIPVTAAFGFAMNNAYGRNFGIIKAKRKLPGPNETLWLSILSTTPSGTWSEEHAVSTTLRLP